VTYASRAASVSERNTTPEFSKALPVFRRSKGNVRSISSGTAGDLAHNFVKTHAEALGKEALEEMFAASLLKFIAIAYFILPNTEDAETATKNRRSSPAQHQRGSPNCY
jgi:hypothetical protein